MFRLKEWLAKVNLLRDSFRSIVMPCFGNSLFTKAYSFRILIHLAVSENNQTLQQNVTQVLQIMKIATAEILLIILLLLRTNSSHINYFQLKLYDRPYVRSYNEWWYLLEAVSIQLSFADYNWCIKRELNYSLCSYIDCINLRLKTCEWFCQSERHRNIQIIAEYSITGVCFHLGSICENLNNVVLKTLFILLKSFKNLILAINNRTLNHVKLLIPLKIVWFLMWSYFNSSDSLSRNSSFSPRSKTSLRA